MQKNLQVAHECCTKGQKEQQMMTHPIVELLQIKAACPKLADSDPTRRQRERRIYERMLAAAVAVMLSGDLQQQYETGNSARYFTQSPPRPPLKYGADVTLQIIGEGAASLTSAAVNLYLLLLNATAESVYKTNVICAEQIVLWGQTPLVTVEAGAKFSVTKSNNLYVTKIYASLDGSVPP